jgi:hypothetical protein
MGGCTYTAWSQIITTAAHGLQLGRALVARECLVGARAVVSHFVGVEVLAAHLGLARCAVASTSGGWRGGCGGSCEERDDGGGGETHSA